MRKSAVQGQRVKEKQGILSSGHTDDDPVSVIDQLKICVRLPDTAKRFFQGRSSSMIRMLSDWVWHK